MKHSSLVFLIAAAVLSLSPACRADVPPVEQGGFNQLHARDWSGKTFREIIDPGQIQRIMVLTDNGGFARHDNTRPDYSVLVQKDYDSFIARLIASDKPAGNSALSAMESPAATLLVTTKENRIFQIRVLSEDGGEISAVLISGAGRGARIDVKDGPVVLVSGEVKTPGEFHMRQGMRLMTAISKAGGFTDFAKTKAVKLIRGNTSTIYDLRKVQDDGSNNPVLMTGDSLIIPPG